MLVGRGLVLGLRISIRSELALRPTDHQRAEYDVDHAEPTLVVRVLPLEVEDRDGSFGDALGGRITQLIVRIEKPILAFRWSVADVDGWRVWPATGHGRLPAFQLSLKLLKVDSAERSRKLGQVGATLFQHRLGADEVSG